jgi:glutamate-1-semialdehyde aminotransferase
MQELLRVQVRRRKREQLLQDDIEEELSLWKRYRHSELNESGGQLHRELQRLAHHEAQCQQVLQQQSLFRLQVQEQKNLQVRHIIHSADNNVTRL